MEIEKHSKSTRNPPHFSDIFEKFDGASFESYLSTYCNSKLFGKKNDQNQRGEGGSGKQIAAPSLEKSFRYTLDSGGKRFRPQLILEQGLALGVPVEALMPWALAIEMVHTYSLIHDDLPCMDNDDIRREKASNHIVFGEGLALLAGDALLTESFRVLAEAAQEAPLLANKGLRLVQLLAKGAGVQGMILGQALDLDLEGLLGGATSASSASSDDSMPDSVNILKKVHTLKTGELFSVSLAGVSILAGQNEKDVQVWSQRGSEMGFCFQLADDLLDFELGEAEPKNYAFLIGRQKCLAELKELSESNIQRAGQDQPIARYFRWNLNRVISK